MDGGRAMVLPPSSCPRRGRLAKLGELTRLPAFSVFLAKLESTAAHRADKCRVASVLRTVALSVPRRGYRVGEARPLTVDGDDVMITRMLATVGLALLVVGSTLAEDTPEPLPATKPEAPASPPPPAPKVEPVAPLGPWGLQGGGHPGTDKQFWISAEYVSAWFQRDPLPALVTTSPPGTDVSIAGVLGMPTTSVLFGNNGVNDDYRSGGRIGIGYWFTPERTFSIEAGGMILESQATLFSAASNGTPILARPFFDVSTSTLNSVVVAFPGTSSGSIDPAVSGTAVSGIIPDGMPTEPIQSRISLYEPPSSGQLGPTAGLLGPLSPAVPSRGDTPPMSAQVTRYIDSRLHSPLDPFEADPGYIYGPTSNSGRVIQSFSEASSYRPGPPGFTYTPGR
jgi:hypothetical protein